MKRKKGRRWLGSLVFALVLLGSCCLFTAGTAQTAEAKTTASTVKNGLQKIGGKYYYYVNGKKQTGWVKNSKGQYRFFNRKDGSMITGWYTTGQGKKRYFNSKTGYMMTGWVKNGKGYYRYFDKKNGFMYVGWAKDSKGRYRYLDKKTGCMVTGWVKNSKGQYRYFSKSTGYMAKGWGKNSKGYRYFSKANGFMLTGWAKNSKGEYRFFDRKDGYMYTGWFKNSKGQKRYFNKSTGVMYTGWWDYKGDRYFFSKNNGFMYTNRWAAGYYFLSDGKMARNMKTPDGKYVGSNGKVCSKSEMHLGDLRSKLQSMINGYSGSWSVYVKDLETGDSISINDTAMYPASVIKLFVMASTYNQINNGKLAKTSYVDSLLRNMITVSDNESFNQLVRLNASNGSFVSGCQTVNSYLKKIGLKSTGCHSTLHPSSSSVTSDGSSNRASAKDAGTLLEMIYKGKCVSKAYSKEMLNLLLNQQRRWKIPAGVPSGIKVANKTGETSSYQHDAAIVYGKNTTYIVCIFSQTGETAGCNGIRSLSSVIYQYLNS